MTSKIFRASLLVAVIVLLCSLCVIMGCLYDYFNGVEAERLQDALQIAAAGTEQEGAAFLQTLDAERLRITWVAADGSVLFDSHAEAEQMESHEDREEIREAMQSGTGSAVRHSDTLLQRTIYEAVRLEDGSVLRMSVSQASLVILVLGMLQPVIIVGIVAVVLSAILAKRMSGRIVEPLNSLDLDHPLENDTYPELSPLLIRINQQHLEIESQLQSLKQKNNEFEQITDNMTEGLVLLDKNGVVMDINPAARKLFGADLFCVGKDFLTVDRKPEMREAVEDVYLQGHSDFRAWRKGREYQFTLNRIESDGKAVGAVVLAFDVTEARNAERSRREFSANVSHELKTPLQSIMGSAELLENGMVKPEDMPRFVGRIRREAARLLNLIEDIMRLSQLDEGAELNREDVDLMALCEEVAAALQPLAGTVTIRTEGEHCTVAGVRRLLYEIVRNLCDNAVKYNVDGGSVTVGVRRDGSHTILTVTDTGIGIPPEHQSRIFERFYRVDKSHSRQSGGTGLGLSIVKHAVQYHNARLELQSTPGVGTTIQVIF